MDRHGDTGDAAAARAEQESDDVGHLGGLEQALDQACRSITTSSPRSATCCSASGVLTNAGQTAVAEIPTSAPSSASVLTNPTPCFAAT